MLHRKFLTVLHDPKIGAEYVQWCIKKALSGGQPSRVLYGEIEIGGFANFSEYRAVPAFLDEIDLSFLRNYSFSDGGFLDVGANLGVISLVLAKRFRERWIHAFEPNPTTFSALVSNISRNRVRNVTPHEIAIADIDGTVLFDADPKARGTASIAHELGNNVILAKSQTLDVFVSANGIRKIALLKVDVEGFESLVFSGAAFALAELRPSAIFFEVCPALTRRRGFDPKAPARQLRALDYSLFRPCSGGRLKEAPLDDIDKVGLENWVAVPQ